MKKQRYEDQPFVVAVREWTRLPADSERLVKVVQAFSLLTKREDAHRWVVESLKAQGTLVTFPAKNLALAQKLAEAFRGEGATTDVWVHTDED